MTDTPDRRTVQTTMQPNKQEPADMPIDASDSQRLVQGIHKIWRLLPRWSRLPLVLTVLSLAPLLVLREIRELFAPYRAGDAAVLVWSALLIFLALLLVFRSLVMSRPTWDAEKNLQVDRNKRPVCQKCWTKDKNLVLLPLTDDRIWHCRVCGQGHKNTEWRAAPLPQGPALRIGAGHDLHRRSRNSFLND